MDGKRTTVRDMRRRNRSVLLSKLYFDGPLSRFELGQASGLSAASVSNLTGELVEEGLVVEAGSVDSDGGRPRILLRVSPGYGHVVGVDVGETRVRVELFDLSMAALPAKADLPFDSPLPTPEQVVEHILSGLATVTAGAGVNPAALLGVGIGVSGTVEQGAQVLVHAQTLGWDAVPLEAMVRAGTDAAIYVDNGATVLGQAEMWFGAGRGARHAVIVLVGSGVGAAVVTHGQSYRGATSGAGEWGHTTIVHGGRQCRCGAQGHLEAYVGAGAVLDRYRAARGGQPVPDLDEESALAALIAAADHSEPAAKILDETADYLGTGIADLINLFNPEKIVLAGWAGLALGARLLPRIRQAAAAQALRRPYAQTSIELCELGSDAVAYGAATLPIARLLREGGMRAAVPLTAPITRRGTVPPLAAEPA
jgi:predicted NBD/HSP70 family sugar kinase